jgi:hypothetical protein
MKWQKNQVVAHYETFLKLKTETENERFGLVFAKTGSINSGTVQSIRSKPISPQPSIPLNDWSYFADPIRIRGFNDQKLQYNLRI